MTNAEESSKSGLEARISELAEAMSAQSAAIRTLCEMVEQLRQELQGVTKTPTRKKAANQLDEPLLIIESAQSEISSTHIPTPDEVRSIRENRGLSVKDAAELVGVKPSTWYEWENKAERLRPSISHAKLIKMLKDGIL